MVSIDHYWIIYVYMIVILIKVLLLWMIVILIVLYMILIIQIMVKVFTSYLDEDKCLLINWPFQKYRLIKINDNEYLYFINNL